MVRCDCIPERCRGDLSLLSRKYYGNQGSLWAVKSLNYCVSTEVLCKKQKWNTGRSILPKVVLTVRLIVCFPHCIWGCSSSFLAGGANVSYNNTVRKKNKVEPSTVFITSIGQVVWVMESPVTQISIFQRL